MCVCVCVRACLRVCERERRQAVTKGADPIVNGKLGTLLAFPVKSVLEIDNVMVAVRKQQIIKLLKSTYGRSGLT